MKLNDIDLASVDHVLRTTRSVRRRLDLAKPVPREVIEQCLDLAIQAPTGGNSQTWRFLSVTDPAKKKVIQDAYRRGAEHYITKPTGLSRVGVSGTVEYPKDDPRAGQMPSVRASSGHLIENLADVPVLLIGCLGGRVERDELFTQASFYGSILPACWSLMLALRARGLGATWTTLHLIHESDVAKALGIPPDVSQAVLLPIAYFTGDDFQPARRLPARQMTYWNQWGETS